MAERLNQFARLHEIVPVESYRTDGVEGWLFRTKTNEIVFYSNDQLIKGTSAGTSRVAVSIS